MNHKLHLSRARIVRLTIRRIKITLTTIVLICNAFSAGAALGESAPAEMVIGDLICRAGSFVLDPTMNSCELVGAVVITKELMVITADRADISLKNKDATAEELDKESIRKISATGNVNIDFGSNRANSEKAVYNAAASTLELEGAPATYTGPGNKITADIIKVTLEYDKAVFTELMGNATITQGAAIFSADYAKIIFAEDTRDTAQQFLNIEAIEAFTATGNVEIEIESGIATSEKAIYDSETNLFELSGPAKYIRGKNAMTAPAGIILDIEEGTIRSKGSQEKPVGGVIFPQNEG